MELNKVGVVIMEESSSRMKKVLAILLAVLFVTSLTAAAVDAHGFGNIGHGMTEACNVHSIQEPSDLAHEDIITELIGKCIG